MNVIKEALQTFVTAGHDGGCLSFRGKHCSCLLPIAQRALPAAEAVEGLVEALEFANRVLGNEGFSVYTPVRQEIQKALTAYKASVK